MDADTSSLCFVTSTRLCTKIRAHLWFFGASERLCASPDLAASDPSELGQLLQGTSRPPPPRAPFLNILTLGAFVAVRPRGCALFSRVFVAHLVRQSSVHVFVTLFSTQRLQSGVFPWHCRRIQSIPHLRSAASATLRVEVLTIAMGMSSRQASLQHSRNQKFHVHFLAFQFVETST